MNYSLFSEKSFLIFITRALVGFCIIFYWGCTTPDKGSLLSTASILRLPQIQDEIILPPEEDSFLRNLVMNLERHLATSTHYHIKLVNNAEPIAFSGGSGIIIISNSIILKLASEDELAFILAHEMAHQQLDHQHSLALATDQITQTHEIEADSFALTLITKAGYNAQSGVTAILNSYAGHSDHQQDSHPLQEERIASLWKQIHSSNENWSESNYTMRRDFNNFKTYLK